MVWNFTKGGVKNKNLNNTVANSKSDSFSMITMLFSNDSKISDDRFNITREFRQQKLVNLNNFFCWRLRISQPRIFFTTLIQQCFESTNEDWWWRLLNNLIAHGGVWNWEIGKIEREIRVRVLNLGENETLRVLKRFIWERVSKWILQLFKGKRKTQRMHLIVYLWVMK